MRYGPHGVIAVSQRTLLAFLISIVVVAPEIMQAREVTLLVPGIQVKTLGSSPRSLDGVKGRWHELIHHLEQRGHLFGGVITPIEVNIRLPECLSIPNKLSTEEAAKADVFLLQFSDAANEDGLAFRALELRQCVDELSRFAGCPVTLVAHSAGGLVARVVLQDALPGVSVKAGTVKKLVTIGTPHLGSALATNIGDLLGTNVTSLKHDARLIERIGNLPLPSTVLFTSIIVRAGGPDVKKPGNAYRIPFDTASLLPEDLCLGGDEVVHVLSQNLRMVAAAKQYEGDTKLAVHMIPIRMAQAGGTGLIATAHNEALRDATVMAWVDRLISDNGDLWAGKGPNLPVLLSDQARFFAHGAVESRLLKGRPLREVTQVKWDEFESISKVGTSASFRFTSTANWKEFYPGNACLSGIVSLEVDSYGRVITVGVKCIP